MRQARASQSHQDPGRPDRSGAAAGASDLTALVEQPTEAGRLADRVRRASFGADAWIRAVPGRTIPATAAIERASDWLELDAWPRGDAIAAGDGLILTVPAEPESRERFARYLLELAAFAPSGLSIAPVSSERAGLHRLWCVAAARIALPPHVHVVARHDLLGLRLAQVALQCGADTLAGPVAEDRSLPLAGVTRPTEDTPDGLATLIRQAGFEPHPEPSR